VQRTSTKWSSSAGSLQKSNASHHMDEWTADIKQLQNLLQMATTNGMQLSHTEQVRTRTLRYASSRLKYHKRKTKQLGLYKKRANLARQQQRYLTSHPRAADILAEMREESTAHSLQEIDSIWWQLRSEIDTYLDAAEVQASTVTSALSMLSTYTSACTSTYDDVQAAYKSTARADKKAHSALKKAWAVVVPKLGLLASQMADGDVMQRLAAADVEAMDVGSLRERGHGCTEALELLMVKAMKKGLWGQTHSQVRIAFTEGAMLSDRFVSAGWGVPKNMDVFNDAQQRAEQSMQASTIWAKRLLDAMSGRHCK